MSTSKVAGGIACPTSEHKRFKNSWNSVGQPFLAAAGFQPAFGCGYAALRGRRFRLPGLALAILFSAYVTAGEDTGHWRLQYFYDQPRSTFVITDLKFPSPKRGIAVGAIVTEKSVKGMSAISSDGGAHWTLTPLREPGESVFFLNDSLGWLVTAKGLWQTEESGRSWRKLKAPVGLRQVWFLDPQHGFAVGDRKQIYETKDGGVEWTGIPAVEQVNSSAEYTRFAWIEFVDKDTGMIGGWSKPPRHEARVPDWLDPEAASERREWPHLGILLDTRDGGKVWTPTTMSLFGQITSVKMSPQGWGLGLIEFTDAFDWPSEVFFLDWKTGKQKRIFREKDRKVTGLAIADVTGPAYLGAVEHFGRLAEMPVPQKVKILRTEDAEHWTEMPVDYRAVARRVILSAAGPNDIWAATDTGMILKLTP